MKSLAILGSGSFGTAIAHLLAPKVAEISIISRDPATVAAINETRKNPHYLKSISLPEQIRATTDFASVTRHPLVIIAVPTSANRAIARQLAALPLPPSTILLSCAKGIEAQSGQRMSEIFHAELPANPIAALSGPNHAEEIATGLATCAVIGCADLPLAVQLQHLFTLPHFRSYTSDDVAGIELGGAIKNVFAIAAGIAHGLGMGDNAVAALVTRALAEMTRLGTALGGKMETFAGLSGIGDLIVTCFSTHSRNHRVGLALGEGQSLEQAVSSLGMVAEGVPNTLSIFQAARKVNARTPILDAVYSILYLGNPAALAMRDLLTRDQRREHE